MKKFSVLTLLLILATLPACCCKRKQACNPCESNTDQVETTKVNRQVTIPVENAGK